MDQSVYICVEICERVSDLVPNFVHCPTYRRERFEYGGDDVRDRSYIIENPLDNDSNSGESRTQNVENHPGEIPDTRDRSRETSRDTLSDIRERSDDVLKRTLERCRKSISGEAEGGDVVDLCVRQ